MCESPRICASSNQLISAVCHLAAPGRCKYSNAKSAQIWCGQEWDHEYEENKPGGQSWGKMEVAATPFLNPENKKM